MRWELLAALLLCSSAHAVAQDAPAPAASNLVVRQSVDPLAGAVIGQHVALLVDVLFHGDMPRPPRVSLPEVAGLQMLRFETQGTTMRETIAGEPYVGQRFEFALYARRGGPFEIRPADITLLDRGGDVTGTAKGQSIRLDVSVPPGVDPSQPVVATRALSLSEQWAPDPGSSFKAGDAIVRTITRTAEGIPGLAMRDLIFLAPKGVRVYADPPEIDDRSNHGVVAGRRVDRVTFVFERAGRFNLPQLSQPWWDLAAGTLRTADAAGATIDVAAPVASETLAAGSRKSGGLAVVGVTAVLLTLLAFGPRYLLYRQSESGAQTEREAFDAVRRACSGTDAGAIYRAYSAWRLLLPPDERRRTLKAAAPLDAALFAGTKPDWESGDSRNLMGRLEQVRQSLSSEPRHRELPPLNL